MSGPGDQPPGVPFRIYGRTDSGRLRFIGIAVVLDSAGGEVRFRWAASRTVRTMPEREWNAWVKEPVNFKVRLFPKLDSP